MTVKNKKKKRHTRTTKREKKQQQRKCGNTIMRQADSPVLIRTGERKSEEKARQETTYYLS